MSRFFFFGCLILTLSGCHNEAADALQSGSVMGVIGLEGRWAGPVTPATNDCGQIAKGQMSVERKTFAFDPFESTTVINGTVADNGGLSGTLSRPVSGQQVVSISFAGIVTQNDDGLETIHGQLKSGRCTWTVTLKRR